MKLEIGTLDQSDSRWEGWKGYVATDEEVVFVNNEGKFSLRYPRSIVPDPGKYPEEVTT